MSVSRRRFLAASTATTASTFCSGSIFDRMAQAAPAADQPGAADTVLVVVQLSGGNDGLNTVIPSQDPAYREARPVLAQKADTLHRIDDELFFHSSLRGFSKLLEDNQLAIVQGIGYPQPNRSHFVSMDIWHKASTSERQLYGWIGRGASLLGGNRRTLYVGEGEGPLALFSSEGHAPALESVDDYQLKGLAGQEKSRQHSLRRLTAGDGRPAGPLLNLVRSSALSAYDSAQQIGSAVSSYDTPVSYPETPLGRRLKLIAQLIDSGLPQRIYYTVLDGFDTHARQAPTHARLLQTLGDAVAAFQQDIVHHGHARRVLTMTFSEFGRRVRENGSQGTDHGAASQMFFIGDPVQAGLIGAHPSLTDLDRGDLKHHTDFRCAYTTIMQQWLKIDPKQVLDQYYEPIRLLKHARI